MAPVESLMQARMVAVAAAVLECASCTPPAETAIAEMAVMTTMPQLGLMRLDFIRIINCPLYDSVYNLSSL